MNIIILTTRSLKSRLIEENEILVGKFEIKEYDICKFYNNAFYYYTFFEACKI